MEGETLSNVSIVRLAISYDSFRIFFLYFFHIFRKGEIKNSTQGTAFY